MLTKWGPILFQNNDFYRQKKVQYMTLLLIGPVLKMVYLGSDIEEKNDNFLFNIHPGPFEPYRLEMNCKKK